MNARNFSLFKLFLLAFFFSFACNGSETLTKPPYPVMDSGVWADGTGIPDIFWLDNNRVLFRGSEETEKRKQPSGKFNLSIWEINKGVSVYARGIDRIQGMFERLCYQDGIIFYPLIEKDAQGNGQYKYGKMGQEKTFTRKAGEKRYFDTMNCQFYESQPGLKERHDYKLLLNRHGYLDYGPRSENRNLPHGKGKPILYYRKGLDKPISLPITNEGTKLRQYYVFRDAYFVYRLAMGTWSGDSETAWWLMPEGKVTEVTIPHGPWTHGGSVGFYPTQKGTFVRYDTFKSNKDPGDAGGYLVTGKNVVRVIVGHLKEPVTSPDGCKVVFVHQPYSDADLPNDPGRVTLKMINFCKEEKNRE